MGTDHLKPLTDEEHNKILGHIRKNIPFAIGKPIAFIYRHDIGRDRSADVPDTGAIGASIAQGIVQAINFGEMGYNSMDRFAQVFVSIPTLFLWDEYIRLERRPLLYLSGFGLAWNAHVEPRGLRNLGGRKDDGLQIPITLLPLDSELIRNDYDLSETPGIRQL